MGIRVKHGPAPTQSLATAYSAGKGQRRERDIEQQNQIALRLQAMAMQNRQFNASMDYRRESDAAGRQHDLTRMDKQAGMYSDRQADDHANRLQLAETEMMNQADRDGRLHSDRLDLLDRQDAAAKENMIAQNSLNRKNVKWEYNEQQKKEFEKLTSGLAWAQTQVAEGKWTPEQGAEVEQQIYAKLHGIQKLPVLNDSPDIQQEFEKLIVKTADGAQLVMDPKSGKFYDPFEKTKLAETKYEQDMQSARIDFISDMMKEKDDVGTPLYNFDQASEMWEKLQGKQPEKMKINEEQLQVLESVGMTPELLEKAVKAEGSVEAVVKKIREKAKKAAEQTDINNGGIPKEEFFDKARRTPNMPSGGVNDGFFRMSGAGGAGGGRF